MSVWMSDYMDIYIIFTFFNTSYVWYIPLWGASRRSVCILYVEWMRSCMSSIHEIKHIIIIENEENVFHTNVETLLITGWTHSRVTILVFFMHIKWQVRLFISSSFLHRGDSFLVLSLRVSTPCSCNEYIEGAPERTSPAYRTCRQVLLRKCYHSGSKSLAMIT